MEPLWYLTKDGDRSCYRLFRKHYSCRNTKPQNGLFVGPGDKIVLRTDDGDAVFVWRFAEYRADKQEGVECTLFRNESSTNRPSLSDRLTQSLITAGLVRGITPSFVRAQCGVPIRAFASLQLDGGAAVTPRAGF